MLIVDASSDMINEGGAAGGQDHTDWDRFRTVIAGEGTSMFDLPVETPGPVASNVIHFGLITFGADSPAPGEQKRVVDYGPCTEPNMRWALDPVTSCEAPGCSDPWGGPPIDWTFVDGSTVDPPGFSQQTLSHMPRCQGDGPDCTGSGRFVHLGVLLATENRDDHHAVTPYTHDDSTLYVNILLTNGRYDGFSSAAETQAELEAAYDAGIVTYVVGFGAGAQTPTPQFERELEDMAAWGSGGTEAHFVARNDDEMRDALQAVLADLQLPCCKSIDCSHVGGAGPGDWDDGGTGTDDGDDGWGGTGDEPTGDGGAGTDGGPIDDDGGCTCRARTNAAPLGLVCLVLLAAARRRR
jgi:hypothetical protein